MDTKEYISYLNSLHNYNAQNENAYAEKNIENDYYQKIMVDIKIVDYITKNLEHSEPHLLVLTGQAGDGKTSIMVQVLQNYGCSLITDQQEQIIELPNGKECVCIKDFSELSDAKKKEVLQTAVNLPSEGKYAFIVTNTGPLINTFKALFDQEEDKNNAEIELIDSIDKNDGVIREISARNYKIRAINVASLDNTYFATKFLRKVIDDELWQCDHENCKECNYCLIKKNRDLIKANQSKTEEFINLYYTWLASHGKRLTIRSITEHIAYMITGGYDCHTIEPQNAYDYLYPNLFFGYIGITKNPNADKISAIKAGREYHLDSKRLCSDEALLINKDYKVFSPSAEKIVEKAAQANLDLPGTNEMMHRFYFFMNTRTGDLDNQDIADIYSKNYKRYLDLTRNDGYNFASDRELIFDGLSMIYTGVRTDDQSIPVTLSRNTGLTQNIQLVVGKLMKSKINVLVEDDPGAAFDNENSPKILKIQIRDKGKKPLKIDLSLPLIDYFEDLRDGVIETDIDPQLSQGLEKLKSQITEFVKDDDVEDIEIAINKSDCLKFYTLDIDDQEKKIYCY